MVVWLIAKVLPMRLIAGALLLVIGTQMVGLDLVTPILDWLSTQLQSLIGSQWDLSSLW